MSSSTFVTADTGLSTPVVAKDDAALSKQFCEVLLALSRRKFDALTDIHHELGLLAEQGAHALQAEGASVWLFSEDHSKLYCVDHCSTTNLQHQQGPEIEASTEMEDFFSFLAGTRVCVLGRKEMSSKSFARCLVFSPTTAGLFAASIWSSGQAVGALVVEHDGNKTWDTIARFFFASLADLAAAMIQSAERFRLETHIQHAQKLEGLGLLSSALAHDLSNLVMSIVGSAGLMLTELSDSAVTRSRVERIRDAAQRAGDLVTQLSVFLGKDKLAVKALDLNSIVSELQLLLQTAVSKKASLQFSLTENLPQIVGDASQLRQLLMNLVTNASEALENKEGVITIATELRRVDQQFLRVCYHGRDLPAGSYVCLRVSDTGTGIKEELQQRIFDPFFSTKVAGKGLGLAGVLGIVRTHGGAVSFSSHLGSGTTFCVLFPLP